MGLYGILIFEISKDKTESHAHPQSCAHQELGNSCLGPQHLHGYCKDSCIHMCYAHSCVSNMICFTWNSRFHGIPNISHHVRVHGTHSKSRFFLYRHGSKNLESKMLQTPKTNLSTQGMNKKTSFWTSIQSRLVTGGHGLVTGRFLHKTSWAFLPGHARSRVGHGLDREENNQHWWIQYLLFLCILDVDIWLLNRTQNKLSKEQKSEHIMWLACHSFDSWQHFNYHPWKPHNAGTTQVFHV